MNKEPQKTYHLYHHQPDPLSPDAVHEQTWLLNNGVSYSVVATLAARTPEDAYQALREKRIGQGKRTRWVPLLPDMLLRETAPGDVLVGEDAAWMISAEGLLQRITYTISHAWKSYTHNHAVECVSWSPDGNHVAAISKVVALHSLFREDERSAPTYHRHHESTGSAVAWSPDGKHIASGGYDGEVHVWTPDPFGRYRSAAIGSLLICRTQERDDWQKITSLAWAPDSCTLFAGRGNGDIVQWNAMTGECLRRCKRHYDDVTVLAYSPDKMHFASASNDGTLRVWEGDQTPSHDVICQHAGPVSAFAWSPDSALLASACAKEDQSLHFWDARSGVPGERIPLSIFSTRSLCILCMAWSPNGRSIAAGCDDGTIQILDVLLRRHVMTYRSEGKDEVRSVAWSPDGKNIAVGGSNRWGNGGKVRIWQVAMDQTVFSDGD